MNAITYSRCGDTSCEHLVHELGDNIFLVGLTATPPSDMEAKEAALYQELFGGADFEIPTPAVVKEGNLAPYQELVYLTQPLDHEAQYLKEEHLRFLELTTAIMAPDFASVPFLEWLHQRVVDRQGSNGSQVSWSRFRAGPASAGTGGASLLRQQ